MKKKRKIKILVLVILQNLQSSTHEQAFRPTDWLAGWLANCLRDEQSESSSDYCLLRQHHHKVSAETIKYCCHSKHAFRYGFILRFNVFFFASVFFFHYDSRSSSTD